MVALVSVNQQALVALLSKGDERMDQAVPLVAYVNGERIVLGTGVIHEDGTCSAEVDPDKLDDRTKNLFIWAGDYSLGVSAGHVNTKRCRVVNCKLVHPHL